MASARPASQRSGSKQETPDDQFRFVIPPAINDCDDVPSLSQHRLQYARQRREACIDPNSDNQDEDNDTESEGDGNATFSKYSDGEVEEEGSDQSEEEEEEEDNRDQIQMLQLIHRHLQVRNI